MVRMGCGGNHAGLNTPSGSHRRGMDDDFGRGMRLFSIISCEARCQVGIASEARSASHALGSEEVAYASGMM